MGQRKLANAQSDDMSKRPQKKSVKKSNNTILNSTTTRKGEVFRAQRRVSENINAKASQHIINIPVNKSIYNGYEGKQFSMADQPKKPKHDNRPVLKVMPIGGLGEMGIGKNMMALEYGEDIVIIDMGFLFPGPDYPGINYITPDIKWLEERKHKIRGVVFTHGHLDHIGAFRHLIPRLPAPVYASRFTIGMLKRTMEESDSGYEPEYNELNPEAHERAQLGDSFSVELVRVNHSIPDATAVVIRTPVGVVIDTGDWRFEDEPVDGKKFDLERLTEIASTEGIMLLMNESTNCENEGTHTHGEPEIKESMGQVMDRHQNSRLIISCFSSQIHRMQGILEEAKKRDRKVAFAGYSMIQNLEVALRAGVIKVPKDVVIKMDDIVKMPNEKVTVVCTGSQGEFNAVLNRMANGSHKHIKIKKSDVVVFSSNAIPGNETYVTKTVDGLMREGSGVIQNGKAHLTGVGPLHVSGHGYHDDHVKLINALNPTYYLPIHGEFHMLVHNARLAENECGIKRDNIFVCDSGDVIEITPDSAKKAGRIPVGGTMYDDSGEVVSEVVLKDRLHMANEGMFIVMLTVQRGSGRLLTSPDIISRGFIYMRDKEELMGMIRQYLKQKVTRGLAGKHVDMDVFKKELKDEITHILYDQTRRTPIVIPVVNEVGGSGGSNSSQKPRSNNDRRPDNDRRSANGDSANASAKTARKFPPRQIPDTEVSGRQQKDQRPY